MTVFDRHQNMYWHEWFSSENNVQHYNFKNGACVRKEENLVDTKIGPAVGTQLWREDIIPDKLGAKPLEEVGVKCPDEALPES